MRIGDLSNEQRLLYSSFAVYNTREDAELVIQIYGYVGVLEAKPWR